MKLEIVIEIIQKPYIIYIENKDNYIETLYEMVSVTSDPIPTLTMVKKNFEELNFMTKDSFIRNKISEYQSILELASKLENLSNETAELLSKLDDENKSKTGQFVSLDKEDIKKLFSLELTREKQLNSILL